MLLTIKIDTSNAAFEDQPEVEVARILRDYADTLANDGEVGIELMPGERDILIDYNGNSVGTARVTA